MAMLKACILQNFATIGIPDVEEEEETPESHRSWSVVALSQNLIDEIRLNGLQYLSTRALDLVIHNGFKHALLNLQAFKVFECDLATKTTKDCLSHYLTPDGNLYFGLEPSGDLIVLTDGFTRKMQIKKPAFIKIQQKQPKWYNVLGRLSSVFSNKSKVSQVSPEEPLHSIQINGNLTSSTTGAAISISSTWPTTPSSHYRIDIPRNVTSEFPYLTSLQDGLAVLCAFGPNQVYIFLSSYETKLRNKSISNIKGDEVHGQWYRIVMGAKSIITWLVEKKSEPVLEARLCYKSNEEGEVRIGGGMLYGVFEDRTLELTYGIINRPSDMFTLTWERLQFEIDRVKINDNSTTCDLKPSFVAKLSSDATKVVIVICSHLGMYIHVQNIPTHQNDSVRLKRQKVALCNHSDYDSTHFYKKECWVAEVQWLVEDTYLAVMTSCGSLSIFYTSGEPMIVKVRKPGAEPDESKSARFYYPVFHPHQIKVNEQDQENNGGAGGQSSISYPTMKWIDTEKVLTCSSGTKIEMFSIQRVLPVGLEKGQSEIWLGARNEMEDVGAPGAETEDENRRVTFLDQEEEGEAYDVESFSSSASTNRPTSSMIQKPFLVPDINDLLRTTVDKASSRESAENENAEQEEEDEREGGSGRLSPVMEYTYEREKDEEKPGSYLNENDNSDYDEAEEDEEEEKSEGDKYPRNDVETPSRIEELPPDGGELEEKLESVLDPTPEKLRLGESAESSSLDPESEKIQRDISEIFLDSEENFISFPSSMHQLDDEYSDGSSEPEMSFVGNGLATQGHGQGPDTSPANQYLSITPDNELNESALRKRSQQYLADDEADYCSEDERRRGDLRRKQQLVVVSSPSPVTPEDRHHPVPPSSSPYYDTDYSRETYSSPFSYVTSTAAEDREEDDEHEEEEDEEEHQNFSEANQDIIQTTSIPTTIHWEASPAAKEARSRTSNISLVSLQIPPVPVISAVIVPSERQSDVLLQSLEMGGPTQHQPHYQQESMVYKPPTTNSTGIAEPPSKVDIIHMKNAAAAMQGTTPCAETNSREYFAEEDNDDEDRNVNRNELNDRDIQYHHHLHHRKPSV